MLLYTFLLMSFIFTSVFIFTSLLYLTPYTHVLLSHIKNLSLLTGRLTRIIKTCDSFKWFWLSINYLVAWYSAMIVTQQQCNTMVIHSHCYF